MENERSRIFNNSRFVLQTCIYKNAVDSGFQYLYINNGENFISDTTENNIIMVMKGRLNLNCGNYRNRIIQEGNMILIPRHSSLNIEVLEDAEVMILRFVQFLNSCAGVRMKSFKKYCENMEYDFQIIPIKIVLTKLIESIKVYLNSRMDCVGLHKLNPKEFFICLNSFYSVDELAYLFYPLVNNENKFRQFVMDNYNKRSNVQDMVEMSGMSKTRFYEKFKVEFGITAKQWMLKHIKEKVCIEALNPDFTVKEIMFRCGFDSAGQFNKFCHQQFKLSPTALIRSLREETEYIDL